MSVASEVTYLRRFTGKFVEIVAAGIGTAVSGYLVAYITGHLAFFSFFTPAAVEPTPPQAISSAAAPRDNASIEATVRAALASHDASQAAPIVATLQPPAPASPETQALPETQPSPEAQASPETASVTAVAPPLDATEIKSRPVAAAVDSPLTAEPDAWPSDPSPTIGTGRLPAIGRFGMLPPQPPPANINVLTALKHFF
jgi:hypothetical protein